MLWFVFIVVLLIFWYWHYKRKPIYDKHKEFAEFTLVLFTVFFTIHQVQSSTDDFNNIVTRMEEILSSAEESKNSLKQVEKGLSNLPDKIEKFSNSIDSLNSTVLYQQGLLSNSLQELNNSMTAFEGTVNALNERYNRKPNIKISLGTSENDSTLIIDKIILTNNGNLTAEIKIMRVYVLTNNLISFKLYNSVLDKVQDRYSIYHLILENSYCYPTAKQRANLYDGAIILSNEFSNDIYIIVYYNAEFGNSGVVDSTFHFKANHPPAAKKVL